MRYAVSVLVTWVGDVLEEGGIIARFISVENLTGNKTKTVLSKYLP